MDSQCALHFRTSKQIQHLSNLSPTRFCPTFWFVRFPRWLGKATNHFCFNNREIETQFSLLKPTLNSGANPWQKIRQPIGHEFQACDCCSPSTRSPKNKTQQLSLMTQLAWAYFSKFSRKTKMAEHEIKQKNGRLKQNQQKHGLLKTKPEPY